MSDRFIFDSDDLVTFCSEFDNSSFEELTDSLLEVNLQDLNDRWGQTQKSYRALCSVKDEDVDREFIESARGKFTACTRSFHKCKAKIMDLQKSLVVPHASLSGDGNQDFNSFDQSFDCIKVPPCDTELFYGGYEEWPAFRDMFTALYIERPRMSPVQKLYYLRLKVKGQAAGIVKKYKLCAENFELAWQALRSRYENRRILVDNQIKILLNLKQITSESSEALQDIQSNINDSLAALKSQNIPIDDWDPIIVYLCSTKLPHETLSLWEQSLKSHKDLPKWSEMNSFLSNRYEVVERLNSIQGVKTGFHRKQNLEVNTFNTESSSQYSCRICNQSHALKSCPEFKNLDPQSRNEFVSKNKICLNCLSYTHLRKDCTSKYTCTYCKRNHHSLLHFPKSRSTYESPDNRPSTSAQAQTSSHFSCMNRTPSENTLLPTAIVNIEIQGEMFKARAFLDQGSEKTFISKKLQHRLMLPTKSKSFQIRGIGGNVVGNSNALCELTLFSPKFNIRISIEAIVVPKITRLMPSFSISPTTFPFDDIKDFDLADPDFHSPAHVDMLLGSNVIPNILLDGVKNVCSSLLAQSTIFGWIISGPLSTVTTSTFSIETTETPLDSIGAQLQRFWEQEEIYFKRPLSKEDEFCESLYTKTTTRNSDGRFIVKLPFKSSFPHDFPLGSSRSQALSQYLRAEKSLKSKPDLAETYHRVLNEYLTLNHMKPTSCFEISSFESFKTFYLPHHAVVKPESRSTKVRVVFNASKRTASGNSLNDVLHVGPTLQADLMMLILNWRLYKFVFNGDIEKMYRQILVYNEDSQFQRILFRKNPNGPIEDYALNTVTFGVNCAPYLAIRTLVQLADQSEEMFPQASHILKKETYVDDILSGSHDLQSSLDALSQVIAVLKSAGFPLKKITSNCAEILESVPQDDILDTDFLKFQEMSTTKTLGIQWNALSDCFSYTVEAPEPAQSITKRKILSTVSKLFDPAGWISPVILQAKILLQQLWLEGNDWDECVKPHTLAKWNQFVETLSLISRLKISRWVNFAPRRLTQVHGFCDASEKAYCATVYLRIINEDSISSHLLVSKGKVAPIDPVTLPRLELCGAVLLSKLVKKITSSLPIYNYDLYLWCDSSIVLGWLEKPPCTWKTYVANRTAEIIRNVGNISWRHVRSADNPADLGSRGCNPQELLSNSLWWHGPAWLVKAPEEWPKSIVVYENPPDTKKIEVFHTLGEEGDILDRFSKWDKAIRVIAYVFRFFSKVSKTSKTESNSLSIGHNEFLNAKRRLISLTQKTYFFKEYESLQISKTICKKSSLYPLNPFLDKNGVIRANGRISNSAISYNERHPIIIPVKSKYCELLVSFTHNLLMHAEHNLMIRAVRNEYYISRLKSAIKKCIRNCKVCVVYKQKLQSQMMAALPLDRSTYSLPFSNSGLDFAGPFSTKTSILRNAPYHKSYVCVFVCFSTKAIHLELCSDLTSGSFQAAFTRFVGRRGLPKKLMSDHGTNFVGAERALSQEFKEFIKTASKDVAEKYVSHGFQWFFIPPNAPHMGGLWEAGVKSFKTHFRKVAQNQKYTFEEFTTLLTRIESVLNSRPLSPMTDDPNELLALTPGHFLIGAPLFAAPEVSTENKSLKDRWERLKALHHQFAQRWKDEYLKELQRRYKWQHQEENVKVGQLVVVKDDLLPPHEWRLGRITQIYDGVDGLVRVADIKTHSGTITRPIVKLCVLPIEP